MIHAGGLLLWRERWLARSEKGMPIVERLQDAERTQGKRI